MELKQLSLDVFKIGVPTQKEAQNGKQHFFILKRNLDFDECKHIMEDLLGLQLYSRTDCITEAGYQYAKHKIVDTVNDWLRGNVSFDVVCENCCPEDLRSMPDVIGMLEAAEYLKDNGFIDNNCDA